MEVITDISTMQSRSQEIRGRGQRIVLVPTMGYFHEGHLSLFRAGRPLGEKLVVSIFVNPLQFGPAEDFERYPRDMSRDLALAESEGVDIVFAPSVDEMYPPGFQTVVEVSELSRGLCGRSRPGHFKGVSTVVVKLFNIVRPHLAVFGRKDYQQLLVIKRLIRDLNLNIAVLELPIVRDKDGLALSSRNSYLSPGEREQALCLFNGVNLARELYLGGERSAAKIVREVERFIQRHPLARIDYITICNATTLEEVEEATEGTLLALAVFVGKTRLIDNYIFGEVL